MTVTYSVRWRTRQGGATLVGQPMAQHELHPHAPRCPRCGDVIGVYEPAILVVDGMARDTSIAAEEGPVPGSGVWQHRDCFVAATVAA